MYSSPDLSYLVNRKETIDRDGNRKFLPLGELPVDVMVNCMGTAMVQTCYFPATEMVLLA